MKRSIAIIALLCTACSQVPADHSATESGAVLGESSSAVSSAYSVRSATETEQEASAAAAEQYDSPHEALAYVHEDAVLVLELTKSVWEDFSAEEQAALQDVLDVFTKDIETLGYYVEISEHEPLTNEEIELVLNVMVDIEDGMEVLAQALETLL